MNDLHSTPDGVSETKRSEVVEHAHRAATNALVENVRRFCPEWDAADMHEDLRETLWPHMEPLAVRLNALTRECVSLRTERDEAVFTLREFNHVEGEPLDDVAVVAVEAYGHLEHRCNALQNERDAQKKRIEQLGGWYNHAESEITRLKAEAAALRTERDALVNERKRLYELWRMEPDGLRTRIAELDAMVAASEEHTKHWEAEAAAFRSRVAELEAMRKQTWKAWVDRAVSAEARVAELLTAMDASGKALEAELGAIRDRRSGGEQT